MSPYQHFRRFLLRWHRRIGVVLMLFVVVLVGTGIALNHTEDLALDRRFIQQPALLNHYGIPPAALRSVDLGATWLSQLAGRQLFLDTTAVADCEGALIGAVSLAPLLAVLCEHELVLLSADGALIDRLRQGTGLPPSTAVGLQGKTLVLATDQGLQRLDLDSFALAGVASDGNIHWSALAEAPPELRSPLLNEERGDGISWERLLLDLHSGRLFGAAGVWAVDIMALALLLIALSGVWVWLSKPGRWRRR